ncbi:MAG: GNAT family N-acetyltransferase [Muribaculaceae bacterium]|nr:GNAT family N-acetyltransferase [Muribaculaceae bacterium]MBR0492163.1 GNAT family N-acetyltransferase [Muribaculaceae bacterium]
MTEIIRYDASMAARWDEFARMSRNGTMLHQRGYMDYHSDRFKDCSLVALHEGRLCALLPACIEGDTLWSHRGLTYGGWLVPLKHFDATVMVEVMDAACQWMSDNSIKRLVYKPVPHIYHRYPCEEDLYALFRHQAKLIETNISTTIDLTCPLPLDRGNKSGANAARKAGIQVGPSEDWEGYWRLLSSLLDERYGTRPVHTLDEMRLLHGRFPDGIRLYAATLDGEMLAGVVMYLSQPVAHCQYIGASPQGKDSKALTLLFDYLIGEAKASGYRYFDFGISNEDHGRYLNEGLVRQKSRLGGRGIVYNTFEINL